MPHALRLEFASLLPLLSLCRLHQPDFNVTLCPHLLGGPLCCDKVQYSNLTSHINAAAVLLDRCPACYQSFLEFFCEFTCSPNQASFLPIQDVAVVNVTLSPDGTTVVNETLAVNSTLYTLSEQYAQKFFNSCRDVKSASTGSPVMQMVFHADNYEEFLNFLGSPGTTQDKSPMLITYEFTEWNASQSMTNVQWLRDCNDSDTMYACSCNDCRWCTGPQCVPHPQLPEEQLVLGGSFLDPLNLGMLLAALTYLAVLMAIWALRASQRHLPSSLVHVSRSAIRSIECGRRAAVPLIVLAACFVVLCIIALVWLLAFAKHDIPSDAETRGKVHFLDSFWEHWLLGVGCAMFALLLGVLLVASCCTTALGSFRFADNSEEEEGSDNSATTGARAGDVRSTHSGAGSIGELSVSSGKRGTTAVGGGTDWMKHRVSDVSAAMTDDEFDDGDDSDDDNPSHAGAGGLHRGADQRRSKMTLSDRFFTWLAHIVATHPWKMIMLAILFTGGSAVGIINIGQVMRTPAGLLCSALLCAGRCRVYNAGSTHFPHLQFLPSPWLYVVCCVELETDPIKLWVPPDSQIFQDKRRFDETFGAFYRTEQVIWIMQPANYDATRNTNPYITANTSSLLDPAVLRIVYAAEQRIQNVTATHQGANVTWTDLCNRPTNQGCIRMSVTGYFDEARAQYQFSNASNTVDVIKGWVDQCSGEPVFSECRSNIGVTHTATAGTQQQQGVDQRSATFQSLICTSPHALTRLSFLWPVRCPFVHRSFSGSDVSQGGLRRLRFRAAGLHQRHCAHHDVAAQQRRRRAGCLGGVGAGVSGHGACHQGRVCRARSAARPALLGRAKRAGRTVAQH